MYGWQDNGRHEGKVGCSTCTAQSGLHGKEEIMSQNKTSLRKQGASVDMTQGSPFRLLFIFSLPLLAGSALQQLYNMVDSLVVGRFVGETALVAVGVSFPVLFMISSLFMGLGGGAMIMVSQYYGAGDKENLRKTIDTIYTAMMVGAVPLTVLGILLANPILSLLKVQPAAWDEAYLYLVILMLGLIGSFGFNANAGILQGVGDSKTPLLFLAIASGINIVLDLVLVLVVPWGVAGVAIATVVAQLFSWLFGIVYINKKYPELKINAFGFKFNLETFKQIIRLGLPAGIQQMMFSIGVIMMTRLVNGYGVSYAAGYSAANKLDTFVFLPIQSIATAITTYTGQNIGAGKLHRVKSGIKAALQMSMGFAVLGFLVLPAGPFLLRMFNDSPEVISSGMAFLNRIIPFYLLLSVQFIINSVMRGAGEALVPMISSLVGLWAARIPAAYLFAHFFGRDSMHFSYAAGWAIGLSISLSYFLTGKWKNKAITRAGNNAEEELPEINET